MKKYIPILTILTMLLTTGCSQTTTTEVTTSTAITSTSTITSTSAKETITTGVTVDETSQENILITESGTYEFSGTYENQTITVNVDKEVDQDAVYLVFNNATISSDTSTPINIIEAKDVILVLTDGTTNRITQSAIETTDEEFPSGAIYSKADMMITGNGSLTVTTAYNDGIHCRDDLIIESGTIVVDAISDGISVNELLQIDGGTISVTAGGGFVEVINQITVGEGSGNTIQATDLLETSMKGIKADTMILNDGTITISAYEDGINVNQDITFHGGNLTILAGDDAITADNSFTINNVNLVVENAYEGLEAPYLTINGGNISVTVLDDALNGNGDAGILTITGGYIMLSCQGDCIDANHDLSIEGGEIIVDSNPIHAGGDGAVDVSGTMNITGGTIVDLDGNAVDPTAMTGRGGGMGGGMPGGMGGGMSPGGMGGNRR